MRGVLPLVSESLAASAALAPAVRAYHHASAIARHPKYSGRLAFLSENQSALRIAGQCMYALMGAQEPLAGSLPLWMMLVSGRL